MKNLTALVAILTATFIFTSCSEIQNPVKKDFTFKATCDTCFTVKVPIQSPINLCAGGNSEFKKITGWKDSLVCMKSNQTINIIADSMNAKGWYYFPDGTAPVMTESATSASNGSGVGSTSGYGSPDWMRWVFWNLLIPIILFLLFLWLVRELLRLINRPYASGTTSQHSETVASTQGNSTAAPTPTQQQPVEVTVENETTVVNDFGSQQRPLFVIKNSGQGPITVGNIHIHMYGDENGKAPETGEPH